LNIGYWILDIGYWILDIGIKTKNLLRVSAGFYVSGFYVQGL